jgi:hypothetical protein
MNKYYITSQLKATTSKPEKQEQVKIMSKNNSNKL